MQLQLSEQAPAPHPSGLPSGPSRLDDTHIGEGLPDWAPGSDAHVFQRLTCPGVLFHQLLGTPSARQVANPVCCHSEKIRFSHVSLASRAPAIGSRRETAPVRALASP